MNANITSLKLVIHEKEIAQNNLKDVLIQNTLIDGFLLRRTRSVQL